MGPEALGWTATAVFAASYFFPQPASLRRVQMVGALLWVGYGLLIRSSPVVAANTIVLAAAAWTGRRPVGQERARPGSPILR